MGKISLDAPGWNQAVRTAQSSVNSFSYPAVPAISKTTISIFLQYHNLLNETFSSMQSLANVVNGETNKMIEVSNRVVQEDQQAAQAFRNGDNHFVQVRFK